MEKPVVANGTKWHFRVWVDFVRGDQIQRIYFWDDERSQTGMVELREPDTLNNQKIKQLRSKLANDSTYRKRFIQPITFPLRRG